MDFILWTIIGVLIFIVYSFWWVLRQTLHSLHDLVNNSKHIGESLIEIDAKLSINNDYTEDLAKRHGDRMGYKPLIK
ncbi:hypothetical protein N9H74_06180 [Hyphomicrobiales bacterium]|nr:hypothetical protein [Hyphomicrobiales bacterium]